jgi:UDP-glucuronate 4-epimerase
MNILVTGAAGFIGFHVARALLERGDEVICVDNMSDYYDVKIKCDRNEILKKYPGYKFYECDIANYECMEKIAKDTKIDKICHLAAQAGVRYSVENPFIYEQTNVKGTLNMFHIAKEFNIPQVVFASSSSVYGKNFNYPSSEDQQLDTPISLYAATKKSGELMAHAYHHLFGIKMTGLRFFNVYGEFGRPDMMTWIFTENILKGKEIKVYNNGDTWKDYTYIDDIKRGVVAALDNPQEYEIVNLGNHTPMHLKRCVEIIEQETGKKAIMNLLPLQPGDVVKSFADVSKAKRLFNWEPTTQMEVGLQKFVRWYKEYTRGTDGTN